MTSIYFVGIYFLARGINFKFVKKNNLEKGASYITAGATIIIIEFMEKWGFFSRSLEMIGF